MYKVHKNKNSQKIGPNELFHYVIRYCIVEVSCTSYFAFKWHQCFEHWYEHFFKNANSMKKYKHHINKWTKKKNTYLKLQDCYFKIKISLSCIDLHTVNEHNNVKLMKNIKLYLVLSTREMRIDFNREGRKESIVGSKILNYQKIEESSHHQALYCLIEITNRPKLDHHRKLGWPFRPGMGLLSTAHLRPHMR